MMLFFIILQFSLLLLMLLQDWFPFAPFNHIEAFDLSYRLIGSIINGSFVFIPLLITLINYHEETMSLAANISLVAFYFTLTIGTVFSWWVPYFLGGFKSQKQQVSQAQFFPNSAENIIPNTLHTILHLQIWSCLALSIYLLVN